MIHEWEAYPYTGGGPQCRHCNDRAFYVICANCGGQALNHSGDGHCGYMPTTFDYGPKRLMECNGQKPRVEHD